MAQIRCPHCETLHDLDDAFLADGPRKMRCASCRTIFEAEATESDLGVTIAMPLPQPKAPKGAASLGAQDFSRPEPPATRAPEAAFEIEPDPAPETGDAGAAASAAPDSGGFDDLPAEGAEGETISADDLEALFADSPPAAAAEPAAEVAFEMADPAPAAEAAELAPQSMVEAQDAAAAAALAAQAAEPGERRANRGGKRSAPPPPRAERRFGGVRVMGALVMAAGVGTLAALMMLRQEAVNLFPGASRAFEMVGLSTAARGLDILDVTSQILREDAQETLEVSGRIVNNGAKAIKLPMMRLAIRAGAGNEIYVWTATADVSELGPKETTRFTRRLASPPAESHSVLVRFVAKDDIVAAIR